MKKEKIAAGVATAMIVVGLGFAVAAPVQATAEHLPICHTGNGTNWEYIAPDASGYNGHQHHEDDIYGLTESECEALNVPEKPADLVVYGDWVDGEYTCDDTEVGQTRTVTTTTWVLDGKVWVEVEPSTVTEETQTRALTADELAALAEECAPDLPDPLVTYSEWTDGLYGCGDTTVEQTRTKTTTPYVLVENSPVLDTANAVVVTETQTRALTEDELRGLFIDCVPPEPETLVVTGDWVDGTYKCGDTEVEQTRTVTATGYVLVDNEWVLDTANASTVTDTQTRALTAQEIDALNCPIPGDKLAYTGIEAQPLLGAALAILAIGITAITVITLRHRRV